jgi:hypothetical protein
MFSLSDNAEPQFTGTVMQKPPQKQKERGVNPAFIASRFPEVLIEQRESEACKQTISPEGAPGDEEYVGFLQKSLHAEHVVVCRMLAGCCSGLRFFVFFPELVHATFGIDEFLLAGEEWMAD